MNNKKDGEAKMWSVIVDTLCKWWVRDMLQQDTYFVLIHMIQSEKKQMQCVSKIKPPNLLYSSAQYHF